MVGKRSVMKENNKMASKRSLNISENEQIFLKKNLEHLLISVTMSINIKKLILMTTKCKSFY